MHKFIELYQFLEFAKNNRKYPESTANNLKSALKIFENVLTEEESDSVELVQNRIEEIFISVVNKNKDKNIASLNTYKALVSRVLDDYKKYGENPAKLQNWHIDSRLSTPRLITKDKPDKLKDNQISALSTPTHPPVENNANNDNIEITIQSNSRIKIMLPKDKNQKEITLRILPPDFRE